MVHYFKTDESRLPHVAVAFVVAGLLAIAGSATAAAITATNLDGLTLGAKIVGPVGPEVETTFVNAAGDGIGDLISSVSCPAGIASCVPPSNPAGTLYTYRHEVTPGVDLPNDPPFATPSNIVPFDGADRFTLGFGAAGFTGIAGYSFSDATKVLATSASITIEQLASDVLEWRISPDAEWNTGESITFFWQTTQPPSGPGGQYNLGSTLSGVANGPLPTPVAAVASTQPLALFALGLLGMVGVLRAREPSKG